MTSADVPPIKDELGDRYSIETQRIETPDVLIYHATDVRAGRPVRLVVSRHRIVDDGPAVKRFYRAAFGATLLEFPHLVRVFGYGLLEDAPYISIEPVAGNSLAKAIEMDEPLDYESSLRVVRDVLAGLTEIHRAGFVHGQLSPEAIRLNLDGGALVIPTWVPVAKSSLRTDPFASPDVADGDPPTVRSDIYSAGKILATLIERLDKDVTPADSVASMQAVADRAMSERQADRYAGADLMTKALVGTLTVDADAPVRPATAAAPEPKPPVKPVELTTEPPEPPVVIVPAAQAPPDDDTDPAMAGAVALHETVQAPTRFPLAWVASAIGAVIILIFLLAALTRIVGDPKLRNEQRPTATTVPATVLAAAVPATPTPRKIVIISDPIYTATVADSPTPSVTATPNATLVPFTETFGPDAFTGCLYRGDAGFLGRPWCSLYGAASGYGTATLRFTLDDAPKGDVTLELTGLDDQSGASSSIEITINGDRIFSGDSPFFAWDGQTDDAPWSRQTFVLPAGTLREGRNTIVISNLNPSANFGQPPFVLVSKVVLRNV